MKNVEWVEVLPFHQMGEFKWKSLGLEYQLADTDAADRSAGENGSRYLPPGRLQGALTMAVLGDFLASQPILSLFLAVALGYAVGQINIFGFSLGIGAVLFVGLAIGAIAPKAQIAGPIGLIGLTMFLYGIGILYGRQFFEGLTGPGRIYNLLAFVGRGRRPVRCAGAGPPDRRRHRRDPGRVRGLDDQHARPCRPRST